MSGPTISLKSMPSVEKHKSIHIRSARFRAILRGGKVTTLHRWMEEARKTGIHSLVRFVRTLKQALSAVESAVSKPVEQRAGGTTHKPTKK
jgi:hypothetical protein